ncbi:MAG TPA: FkbM family methyltransferase [Nocardioidaceae bacterium]|nr:FkbM family methyltransferase [Nocardioidaceae bacterium]
MSTSTPNAAIAAIEAANEQTLRAVADFRAAVERGAAGREQFSELKQKHRFIGFVPCHAGGVDFALFAAHDDVVAWEYLWFGADAYEADLIALWVDWCRSSPGVVYDVGGYTGIMSVLAAKSNTENQVHLFEPIDRTIERAKINSRANKVAGRVTLHNVAASDAAAEAKINLYRSDNILGTGNSLYDKGLEVRDIKTITCVRLDDELPDLSPTVVKVDVEGHELAAVRGMQRTIVRARPRMLVEVWDHTRDELLRLLDELDYDCRPLDSVDRRVVNYACLPR